MTDLTTIALPTDTFVILAGLIAIAALSVIVVLILPSGPHHDESPLVRYAKALGFRIKSPAITAILLTVIVVYALIFLLALIIALRALGGMVFDTLPEITTHGQTRAGLAFGTLLAAILGAPFIIWRSCIAAKQTAVAEDALFNDKINATAQDLAARRQVTRIAKKENGETDARKDDAQIILTEWDDDLVTRAAAIDRLSALALERPAEAPRIARLLASFVQENSRIRPAKEPPFRDERHPYSDGDDHNALSRFFTGLQENRNVSTERAIKALSIINCESTVAGRSILRSQVNLSSCNLQGLNFSAFCLDGFNLSHARLEGTTMNKTSLAGANLAFARLNGAILTDSDFGSSNCVRAQFTGGLIIDVDFSGTDLRAAQFDEHVIAQDLCLRGARIGPVIYEDDPLKPHYQDVYAAVFHNLENHPSHWYVGTALEEEEIRTQWRAWAAALDPPVTIAPDYRP